MINCLVKNCDYECDNYFKLSQHIRRNHNMTSNKYYDKYLKKEKEEFCICGKKIKFLGINKGYYSKFCSSKCSANDSTTKEKRIKTNIEKYGVKNVFQSDVIKEKIKESNIEKYGVKNVFQNEEIKEKIKQINMERYGFESPSKNKEIKNKIKQTNLERYGVESPLQNKKIKEKIKQINLERYGVKSPLQNKSILNKVKNTNIEKYGVENVFQNEEIKDRIKKTNLEKYGVDNPMKCFNIKENVKTTNIEKYGVDNPFESDEIKDRIKKTNLEKYGVDNPIKSNKIIEKIKQNHIIKFIPKINKLLEYNNLELISKYNNSRELIKLKCLKCNTIFETQYFYIQQGHGKCPNCFPKYRSIGELKLNEFINSFNLNDVYINNRNITPPYELDIYIPDKNIAIEFNGLYWHSEEQGKDKNYHLNKTELCEKQHIQLIHIFEDEWIFKQDIVKSRLKQILGISDSKRIHARKCIIKEISPKIKNEFLNKYHIQGEDRSNIKLGAFYNDELVSVMTFSKGNISKGSKNIKGVCELNRFCSNSNYHIPGIASKLLSYFKRNYEWKEIYSYADRRWSQGNVYYKLGFKLEHITQCNYFYIGNDYNRIHRFNLRKRSNESKNISECILRQREGYYRIWDCGHYKFRLTN